MLTDGDVTITYNSVLQPGEVLMLDAQGRARLQNGTLLPTTRVGVTSQTDPSGYQPFTKGYGVIAFGVYRTVTESMKRLKVTVSGKVQDGCTSMLCLSFRMKDGAYQTPCFLIGAFKEQWGTYSETVDVPTGAVMLFSVCCYRQNQKGTAYYGTVTVENASYPTAGVDVSDKVQGTLPVIPADGYSAITYRHRDLISSNSRVRVQLQPADSQAR